MDENGRKAFGAYIKSLREGAHLTQKEAALRSKLSAPYLAQMEKGQRNPPSRAALTRLAETYGVTPQSLWDQAEYGTEQVQFSTVTPERVEWAFQTAASDPTFSYGHRARQGPLTLDQKLWFVQLWEKSTGSRLLVEEAEEASSEEASSEDVSSKRRSIRQQE